MNFPTEPFILGCIVFPQTFPEHAPRTTLSVGTSNKETKPGTWPHGTCIILHHNSMQFPACFCRLVALISCIRTLQKATISGCKQLTGITERMRV